MAGGATEGLPYAEAERLAVLDTYGILDTAPEKEYDDVVALAARICETPAAAIILIGAGRQFFKAEKGIGDHAMPLDLSSDAHALLRHDLFEIEDATKDGRFSCNPHVTGNPVLRFYTGAALKTPEGLPLGTLCVLDVMPRKLSDYQKFALQTLAAQVMARMQLRLVAGALAAAVKKLEVRNAQLSHFNHAIAHDLRSPLSTVIAAMELFGMKYGSNLDANGVKILDMAGRGTQQIRELIASLLTFAERDSDVTLPAEDCDGGEALAMVLENLQALITLTGADIRTSPLPRIGVSKLELVQVLQNLIANALNYRDQSRKPEITVSARQEGNVVTVSVADNGIGIEAASLKEIFRPLKRLHGTERPGSGLGLAIVTTIIDRRHGKVWVDSETGQGSIFRFSLPAAA